MSRTPATRSGLAPSPIEQDLLAGITLARMWRDLEFLCGLDRASGTEGERRAMEYIATTLRADGVRVDVHTFDAYLSYPITGTITVEAGEGLPADIPAKTRAFSGNTPPGGLGAEVIYVAGGHDLFRDTETHRRLERAAVEGKIVLSEAGSRRTMQTAQEQGAVAYIHMWPSDEDAIHEGIVSPVWGSPTPEASAAFPRIPILSVTRASGEALRAALGRGPVRLRISSRTETGWRRVTLPVATIPGATPEFVLFSGHVDSWHLGATDNATGNAVTMEVARVLHAQRDRLRRGVRCAFWPGHSTGRYAGSTWYADQHWQDLYDHCVLHINCDSPGVVGATEYSPVTASAEASAFGVALIRELTGQDVEWERPVRAGDQSFWGAGVPSLFMGLSVRPKGQRWAVGGSGLGWWWHTEADTIDKVSPDVLILDTQIYLLASYRVATAPMVPLRIGAPVAELQEVIAGLRRTAGERFDLSPVIKTLDRLRSAAARFDDVAGDLAGASATRVEIIGRAQRAAVRALVQIAYTSGRPFEHDPAIPQLPIPSLQEISDLVRLPADDHASRLLHTRLVRRRNRVVYGLRTAADVLETALAGT
ncbi:MAG: M28 family peptidase [bacterium]